MLPLINNTFTPVTPQPSVVATPVPESSTLRVPPTTVAPSVSNAQVDPNASGKNPLLLQTQGTPSSPAAAITQSLVSGTVNLAPEKSLGAPATLLAQMIGQNLPPEAQNALRGVLNEYEKIVINSYVKYMPSNASLPQSEPASEFSQIVKQSATPVQEKPAPSRSATSANSAQAVSSESAQEEEISIQVSAGFAAPKPSYNAMNAYAVAASRLSAKTVANDDVSIEETNPASK
ncbi:MAG: hypothetical protein ACK502_05375 [Alphaproteobacteria bacterium]